MQSVNQKETFRFVYAVNPEQIDTGRCRLFMELSKGFLNFCIFDTVSEKIILFKQLQPDADLQQTLDCEPWFAKPYSSIVFLYRAHRFNISPLEFDNGDQQYKNVVDKAGIVCGWNAEDSDMRTVREFFGNLTVKEYHSVLLEMISAGKLQLKGARLFISAGDASSHLMLINENRLLFANSFETQSPEEVLYFCLKILKECSCQPESTILVPDQGMLDRQADMNLLKDYFLRTEPVIASYPHYNGLFSEADIISYFPLLNLDVCG